MQESKYTSELCRNSLTRPATNVGLESKRHARETIRAIVIDVCAMGFLKDGNRELN